jgi:hypothetical protein
MNRILRRAIAVVACSVVAIAVVGGAIVKGHGRQDYVRNTYFSGPREVTVKTSEGTVLSVLQVPSGVELSIHVVREAAAVQSNAEAGDVVIRVLPKTRLTEGPLLPQMMQAPFELFLQNVEVSVK